MTDCFHHALTTWQLLKWGLQRGFTSVHVDAATELPPLNASFPAIYTRHILKHF